MKHLENEAFGAVRRLLCDVPNLRINSVEYEPKLGNDYRTDGLVSFSNNGEDALLLIEAKANGAPRHVRSAIYQLESYIARLMRDPGGNIGKCVIPMLVSPYLSPESRAICSDHDVAYLDLFGNARLVFDSVYIDRTVAERPVTESRALRSLFKPKAAAILRVLLREPNRAWRVAELAQAAHASYGHVSNVRRALRDRELIQIRSDGVVLSHPKALLEMWRESYRRPIGEAITGYTILHGKQFDQKLRGILNPITGRPRAIYSLHSAAQWLAPYVRSATYTFYVDEAGANVVRDVLNLSHSVRGANVMLSIVEDEGLFFDAIEPASDVFCTSPIVTYLDLWTGNDRDQEAAKHLAEEFFSWMS